MQYLAHVPFSAKQIVVSPNYSYTMSQLTLVVIYYVYSFFHSPMKISFHIIRRTEHLEIEHSFIVSLFYREFQSSVTFVIHYNMANMTTSFNRDKCSTKFKFG